MSDATSTVTNYDVSKMDSAKMANLGQWVKETFAQYEKDRKGVEEQWLRNLRQFRGIYDPDIANRIPDDQSTAYPKITRNKVIGTVARLMEMLFPPRGTDKNFEVACSPLPDLQQADLQTVLDTLSVEAGGKDLTDEVIERGIRAFAAERAKRLEKEVEDQLAELDYVRLAKRIVFSAVLYSVGIMKGPMIVQEEGRTWSKAPDGKYVAQTVQKKRPYFENVSNWDWFTDLSAKTIDATDADCQRHIMNRTELRELADRKDFLGDAIREYLRTHTTGNYKQRWWETELRAKSADKSNVSDLTGRKYEAIEFWGRINGHQLAACGVAVPNNQLEDEVEANLWVIDNVVIKATMNPYDGRIRGYHTFIYEEDDINLLGNGLPVVMRDSQLAICEAARMILDNGSVVCGPMVEANISLLMPGSDTDIYARKVWLREDTGPDAGVPAVRSIEVQSHINELIQIIELFQGFADSETALPPPALGDVSGQGKESMRTTGNLSMLMGAAALPIRDTVRNFDKFTVSFISSLCYWNLEFNPNPNIKGDFKVLARGSTSLIAKEVRATALDQFWLTLDPEDKMYFDRTKILKERMRVRDLPDDMLDTDENIRAKLKEQADSSAATAQQQGDLMRAQIRGEVAAAFKDLMLGLKAQAAGNADVFNTITERIIDVRNSANDALAASKAGGSGTSSPPARAPERAGVAGAG